MKIQVKFVADDGTSFDDEKECKAYEEGRLIGGHAGFVHVVRDALSKLVHRGEDFNYIPFDDEIDDGQEMVNVAIALSLNWNALNAARAHARVDALGPEELSDAVVNSKRSTKPKRK
jgi:hypothetical protein